jgi:hypothetical protein
VFHHQAGAIGAMTGMYIIVWFAWFFGSNWLEHAALKFSGNLKMGVRTMKKEISLLLSLFFAAFAFLAIPNPAAAQDDPPGRVARLSYLQGSISFQPSGTQDWIEANPSRPMTTGDNLWADKNSRAEIHIGSTAIRLASETGISFLNIDDRTVQIQLAQGIITVHLRHYDPSSGYEIDTPNLAFQIASSGEYRIETDPNGGSTVIIVREGSGEVTGGGQSYDLHAGAGYTFNGTEELDYTAQPAPGFDGFEDWSQERDQRENNSPSARYVSRDIDGYYDLDDNGTWQNDPDYGAIWVPNGVVAGWAPYHFGHWVWIAPWGWTWVDDAPWGFAPFHYGRWAYVRGYWGWVPGPIVVRPYYAPALVAFVGGGWGVSVGVGGFVGVGWYPLGPRDVFVPGYHVSPRYFQTINVTNTRVVNVTQVTNVYNNYYVKNVTVNNYTYQNEVHAVTVVHKEDFVNARPVRQAAVNVQAEQIRAVRVVDERPLAPTRNSYVSAAAKPAPPSARPPAPIYERKVVTKMNPPIPPTGGHQAQFVDAEKKPAAPPPPTPKNQPNYVAPNRESNPPPPTQKNEGGNAQPNKEYNPPAARVNNPPPPPPKENTYQRGENQPNNEPHPAVNFTPPVRAKDEMYDVHPPLNKQPPKTEERKAEPPPPPPPKQQKEAPKDEKHNESKPSR